MRDEVEQLLLVERTLGLAMLQPQVMERMVRAGVAAAEFEHEAQAAMYRAMVASFERYMRADAGTVEAAMRADGWEAKEAKRWVRAAEDAGRGASIDDETLTAYIDAIHKQAAQRRLTLLAKEVIAAVAKGDDISDIAGHVSSSLDAIMQGSTSSSVWSGVELAADFMRTIGVTAEEIIERAPTGIRPIDDAMGGGPRLGTTMIFAAATGIGKTTFLLHMMLAMMRAGRRVLIFPFEQDAKKDIYPQLLEMCAGIRRKNAKTPADWSKMADAAAWLSERFWIDDAVSMTVEELASKVHMHVRKNRVDVVFVDYVQDIQRSTRHERDDMNYTHISTRLRHVAKTYNILVVESAQLKVKDDKAKTKNDGPIEDDIAGSRQFAWDSSCTITADRNKLSDDPVQRNTTRIKLVKDRFDKSAPVRAWMRYDQTTTRLADCDAHGHILEPAKAGAPMQPALEPQAPAHDDFLDSPEDAWDAATKKT